ncbi:AB-hydrolase YheT [Linderina pennispora]|uniref:AB-hydrolase YheT n=1 Tax=Linderina pennispora TaxID=61395 RepID=A0A1Y1WLS3_9FUNG|nr:AB-hydrolase YheT [Linderina pennispora]ORX74315.1 AB-hydrolase YheT [Linderina pennispora]
MSGFGLDRTTVGLAALGLTGYYAAKQYIEGCKVEVVTSGEKASAVLLQSECPSLTDPSKAYMIPTPYLCTGLLQTFYATFNIKRRDSTSDITYDRELLVMADGGTVSLDWYPSREPREGEERLPVVFTLSGCRASALQYSTTVAHRHTPITAPRPYDSGFTSDLRYAIDYVREKSDPAVKLAAVGFSMGSNILTKYVGEQGDKCPAISGAAITEDNFLNNKVFQPQVLGTLKRAMKRGSHVALNPEWGIDIDRIMNSTKLWEIEEEYLVKVNGYESLDEYYSKASAVHYVDRIRIPYLAINSLDDRITPPVGIPMDKFKTNPNLALALVPHGGHLAFLTGLASPRVWFIDPIAEFLSAITRS